MSTRDYYEFFEGRSEDITWAKLCWKLYVHPSRAFIFWRVMHGRVPVDEVCQRQGTYLASQCYLCKQGVESVKHLFKECGFIRRLWNLLASQLGLLNFPTTLKDIILQVKSMGLSSQVSFLLLIGCFEVVWLVWRLRNRAKHDDIYVLSEGAIEIVFDAITRVGNLKLGCMNNIVEDLLILRKMKMVGIPRKPIVTIHVVWLPPPIDFMKINTDEACLGNGRAAAGGVVRWYDGSLMAAFSVPIRTSSVIVAEARAVLIAIDFARRKRKSRIWLETDSLILYGLLCKMEDHVPWEIRREWAAALVYLSSVEFCITHIFREGNQVADKLAELVLREVDIKWWSIASVPEEVRKLVANDACSLTYFRRR